MYEKSSGREDHCERDYRRMRSDASDFYRNFQDKYDLINWYFDKILIESFEHMGEGQTVYESLVNKFQYIQKETLFFRAALKMTTRTVA